MRTLIFATITLPSALVHGQFLTQAEVSIDTPDNVAQCSAIPITWTGGRGPYDIHVHAAASNFDSTSFQEFIQVGGSTMVWQVEIRAGTEVVLSIRDDEGFTASSGTIELRKGTDDCLSQRFSSAASNISSTAAFSRSVASNPEHSSSSPLSLPSLSPLASPHPPASSSLSLPRSFLVVNNFSIVVLSTSTTDAPSPSFSLPSSTSEPVNPKSTSNSELSNLSLLPPTTFFTSDSTSKSASPVATISMESGSSFKVAISPAIIAAVTLISIIFLAMLGSCFWRIWRQRRLRDEEEKSIHWLVLDSSSQHSATQISLNSNGSDGERSPMSMNMITHAPAINTATSMAQLSAASLKPTALVASSHSPGPNYPVPRTIPSTPALALSSPGVSEASATLYRAKVERKCTTDFPRSHFLPAIWSQHNSNKSIVSRGLQDGGTVHLDPSSRHGQIANRYQATLHRDLDPSSNQRKQPQLLASQGFSKVYDSGSNIHVVIEGMKIEIEWLRLQQEDRARAQLITPLPPSYDEK